MKRTIAFLMVFLLGLAALAFGQNWITINGKKGLPGLRVFGDIIGHNSDGTEGFKFDSSTGSVGIGHVNTTEGTSSAGWEGKIENDASEEMVGASSKTYFWDETDGTEDASLVETSMVDGVLGTLHRFVINESVADDGTITIQTGLMGVGWIMAGDNEAMIHFSFKADGTVYRLGTDDADLSDGHDGSPNYVSAITDNDGDLCVYDGGSGIVIKNRLGAVKVLRGVITCDD